MASFNSLAGWATAQVPYMASNELWEGGVGPHYHGVVKVLTLPLGLLRPQPSGEGTGTCYGQVG